MSKLMHYIKTAIVVVKSVVTTIVASIKEFVETKVATTTKAAVVMEGDVIVGDPITDDVVVEDTAAGTISKYIGYGILFVISYLIVSMYPITILYIMELIAVMQLFLWVSNKI